MLSNRKPSFFFAVRVHFSVFRNRKYLFQLCILFGRIFVGMFSHELSETPQYTCKQVVEQLKKSGEFDKYRRQLVDKIVRSDDVQKIMDQCKEIVERTVASVPNLQRSDMARFRETVKNEIKRRRLVDNALNATIPQCLSDVERIITEKIEDIVRSDLDIVKEEVPLEDSNMELVDMEVSSGDGRSSVSSFTKSSSSTSKICFTDET